MIEVAITWYPAGQSETTIYADLPAIPQIGARFSAPEINGRGMYVTNVDWELTPSGKSCIEITLNNYNPLSPMH